MLTITAESLKSKVGREKAIFKIVEALRADEIVIAPIDQGFAYIADPNSDVAMAKIKEIKAMAPSSYFALLVHSVEQIHQYCGPTSTEQRLLAKEFWPGPLLMECAVLPGVIGSFGSDGSPDSLFFRQAVDPVVAGICEMSGPVVFSPILDADKNTIGDFKKLPPIAKKSAKYGIGVKRRWSKDLATIVSFSKAGAVIKKIGGVSEQQIRTIIPSVSLQ